jgi:hypothetical protein
MPSRQIGNFLAMTSKSRQLPSPATTLSFDLARQFCAGAQASTLERRSFKSDGGRYIADAVFDTIALAAGSIPPAPGIGFDPKDTQSRVGRDHIASDSQLT